MMIPPPSAGDPFQAAAALNRAQRSCPAPADASQSDSSGGESGPDVVVTLGKPSGASGTYDKSGKMSAAPSLDDMGANAPDPLAMASDSGDATASDAAAPAPSASGPGASVDIAEAATA